MDRGGRARRTNNVQACAHVAAYYWHRIGAPFDGWTYKEGYTQRLYYYYVTYKEECDDRTR